MILSSPSRHPLVIGVIHLLPLQGSPGFGGQIEPIFERALREAEIYSQSGIHSLIIENFGDAPFFPESVPSETIASMAAICREVLRSVKIPVGVNVLRNDANAALSIAAACGADFVRVNVHTGAMLSDQGILQGKAAESLRHRKFLMSETKIFADVMVKHAAPLVNRGIENEVEDLIKRGKADAVIVSGSGTGKQTDPHFLETVKGISSVPVFIGSGITAENISQYKGLADGFIVGSSFKENGNVLHPVDSNRVRQFMEVYHHLFS